MSDLLLELSKNPPVRRFLESLGLPLSLPEQLRRAEGPWKDRPLEGARLAVYSARSGELVPLLARTVMEAGADVLALDGATALAHYEGPAEAWGRKAIPADVLHPPEGEKVRGIIVDATGIDSPRGLRAVYDCLHAWVPSVERSGRVVLVARPPESTDATAVATRAALEGFVRALAKELGRRGATANWISVERGAEERATGPLRFLLSPHSAFITGQPLRVSKTARPNRTAGFTRPLHGKIAIVTGAARGIGEATAVRLSEEGAHVVCVDRPAEDGPVSQLARRLGGTPLLLDVSEDGAEKLVEFVRSKWEGVDIVVHNAGVTRDKTLARMSPEAWEVTIGVNLEAPIRMTRALLDAQLLRDGGRVLCLSSVSGIAGNAGQTNYSASKAGLIGFVRALSSEVGARGITANAIAPGFIETRMTAAMPAAIREVARRLSALGQGGQPVDVAEAITFLSMPFADGITGTTLRVCGGAFIGA